MIRILFLILFTFFIIYIVLGVYILSKDRRSKTNRAFFMLCMTTSLWVLGTAFMAIAPNKYIANYWRLVSAAGWCTFFSSWLEFAISIKYIGKVRLNRKKNLLIYIPPVIFFINNLRYNPNIVVIRFGNGWTDVIPINAYEILFIVYYIACVFIGIILIYQWGAKSTFKREKKQSRAFCISALIAFFLGVPTDTVLPLMGINVFPMASIFVSIFMLGVGYAILKYKMMIATPQYVSDYIFRAVNDPIFFIGQDFFIQNVNEVALRMTGYNLQSIKRKRFNTLVADSNFSFYDLIKEGNVKNIEVNLLSKDQHILQYELSGTVIYDEFDDMLGIVIILHDISERKKAEKFLQNYNLELENKIGERTLKLVEANLILKNEITDRITAEEKIRHMGYYDELTDLPNRRYFNEAITKQIKEIHSTSNKFAIMYLDLDNFKLINDTFGHQQGDNLLKYFANCMKKVIRETDVLARVGGDEFIILVTNLQEESCVNTLNKLSKEIMNIFNEPFLIENKENFITTSIGLAFYPDDGKDAETLIMNADIAMYEAKNLGKNNVKICSQEVKDKFMKKTKYRNSLYRAVEKDELIVYYQPQVSINSNKIIGFEALLRWKADNKYFVSPSEFIPILEETGLIVTIGYWVIKTACTSLKKWHNLGFPNTRMAINLSVNQLNEKDFTSNVIDILNDIGLEPAFLEFEITERITLSGNENIKKKLEELKRIGVKISIDDFGTDYSSFMNLKKLPIDKIKIAMEFTQELNKNKKDDVIVSSIIELSHSLELDVIAEGVETVEQLEFLKNKKCDEIQGYLYYKPMPDIEIEKIMSEVKLESDDAC